MEVRPRQVIIHQTADGREPFLEWLEGITDERTRNRILARITRVRTGNFGYYEAVGEGVLELKLDFGPGYRIYFGQDGDIVVLLGGGDKGTQNADIRKAKELWGERNA